MEGFENNENQEYEIKLAESSLICRICLKQSDSKLFKVEDYLWDLYLSITKIDVSSTASLSKNICKECIKTLEDISSFVDIAMNRSGKNVLPKNENEHVTAAQCVTSQKKHAMESEEYKGDSQYFRGFEICQICYSTKNLKPVEGKGHLMQLFQNITNMDVKAETAFSYRNSICNKCIKTLETISLFIDESCNEIKLENTIGNNEALDTENYSEENAANMKYKTEVKNDDFDENAYSYNINSLHTHTDIKEEIVNTPEASENVKFATKNNMKSHLFTHTAEKPFKCDCCEKTFTRKEHLQNHMISHTGEKPFQCSYCEKKFVFRKSLKSHLLTHTAEKPFQCDFCEKSFIRKDYLQNHMVNHSGKKAFQCDRCEKKFVFEKSLKSHLLSHTAEKSFFKCDLCEKTFIWKGSLRNHMPIHSGEKPFKCDRCQKSFILKGALQNHMLVHTGEKRFKCDCCDKSFSSKRVLKSHSFTHTTKKPFKCNRCEKSFTQKSHLNRHTLVHTEEKPSKTKSDCREKSFGQKSLITLEKSYSSVVVDSEIMAGVAPSGACFP